MSQNEDSRYILKGNLYFQGFMACLSHFFAITIAKVIVFLTHLSFIIFIYYWRKHMSAKNRDVIIYNNLTELINEITVPQNYHVLIDGIIQGKNSKK